MQPTDRAPILTATRVVVKIGTAVLTDPVSGLATDRLQAIVAAIAAAHHAGREVIVVSSGAVGLGRAQLGLDETIGDLATRQACAAVGQGRLVAAYDAAFGAHGVKVGQVLLSRADFDDRARYLNLRSTLSTLLRHGIVPIINENDAVATDELAYVEDAMVPVFGDNDGLSALVATKLGAGLLVLLTDVDGVYRHDPHAHPNERPVDLWTDAMAGEIEVGDRRSVGGRGGMASKLSAAIDASRAGCGAVIASGVSAHGLARVLAGEDEGTWFPPAPGMPARDRWIAFGAPVRGVLVLDTGAVAAVLNRGASLLAAGVVRVEGDFLAGDIVSLKSEKQGEIGRGIAHCSAQIARSWAAGERPDGVRNHDALVHRDHLVVLT
jgi:glutamate 5-kinase